MKVYHALLYSLLLVLGSGFSSCKYSQDYLQVNANNQFSLSIPSWMKEDKSLKEGAAFQYANHFRNFYAIGEATPKGDLKRTTGEIMSDNLNVLRKSLGKPVVTDSLDITAGDVKGVRVEIYGKMNDENIYFTEVLYEGKNNLYHISVWTRSETRKLRFKEDINKLVASFKEI